MANPSKRRGDDAEREVAARLAELTGWPAKRALGAGRKDDIGDIHGIPQTTLQVKNRPNDVPRSIREGLACLQRQQANSGDPFGAVLVRRRGGHWIAVLTLEGLATLLREATTPADDREAG